MSQQYKFRVTKMGNTRTKSVSELLPVGHWRVEGANAKSRIFKNQHKLIAQELFVIVNTSKMLEQELEVYLERKRPNSSVVGVYSVEIIEDQNYFCSDNKRLRVLFQYFPKSIRDIDELNFNVLVYVLSQALKGFKQIFKSYGRVKVQDNLIGISNQGVVKVWVNPNFALNHPVGSAVYPGFRINTKEDQILMVRDILNVLKPYCKGGNYPLTLINYFNRVGVLDFDAAIGLVERYSQDIEPQVPQLVKNRSIIDQLLKLSQTISPTTNPHILNSKTPNPPNTVHTDDSLPSQPLIRRMTSDNSFFSNLSQIVNEKITNNTPKTLETHGKEQIDPGLPQLKRFASIPNIRPYQSD